MTLQIETPDFLTRRPRRNRKSAAIRSIVRETRLHPSNLIAPLFVLDGQNQQQAITSMPGIYRKSIDLLIPEIIELYENGIRAIDLFPFVPPELKDDSAAEAIRTENLFYRAVQAIKSEIPEMCVMVDIALDPFTLHGHDGVINEKLQIDNDATLQLLGKMSLVAAQAGADVVAPSDMMDGRIAHIRNELDREGYQDVSILAYTAKYASALYGPFREALQSAPKFGDKKTYQMDSANVREALLEAELDESEGADFLLVKPALPYLDVIAKMRAQSQLPIGAYHVSGEYSMVMAAAEKGWLDADKVFLETLTSIKRAGADFILTYTSGRIAPMLRDN